MNKEEALIVPTQDQKLMSVDMLEGESRKQFCSFNPTTEEEKVQLYNALQQCDEKLMDHLGEVILLKNVICQEFRRTNEETGEVSDEVRTVLIDENGKSYGTASRGIFLSLAQVFRAFGEPNTWKEARPIRIKEKTTGRNRKTYIIELVSKNSN